MADAPKKNDKAPVTPKVYNFETFITDALIVIFGLFILGALLGRIALVFGSSSKFSLFSDFSNWFLEGVYPTIKIISIILSLLFIWGIILAARKLTKINNTYNISRKEKLQESVVKNTEKESIKKAVFTKHWHTVLNHASSNNKNDWKIAILDADSILDDVLKMKGFMGDTMADRLKAVSRGDLASIDLAWEAHKYRNAIAHGDDISFNQHEVRRIIYNFEKALKELGAI